MVRATIQSIPGLRNSYMVASLGTTAGLYIDVYIYIHIQA